MFLMETGGVCANCVAGKWQDDCLNVFPDMEALSWLSVSCPSLVGAFLQQRVCHAVLFTPSI